MSACNASRLRAVSLSVSPLVRLDVVAEILITSALNRSAASSKDVRVRVLGSTKKFTSVFPRRAGTFLISRVPTCLNASAVSRTKLISSVDNSRRPSKSFRFQRVVMVERMRSLLLQTYLVRLAIGLFEAYAHLLVTRGRQILANIIRANGQLAMAAVDQYRELNS